MDVVTALEYLRSNAGATIADDRQSFAVVVDDLEIVTRGMPGRWIVTVIGSMPGDAGNRMQTVHWQRYSGNDSGTGVELIQAFGAAMRAAPVISDYLARVGEIQ